VLESLSGAFPVAKRTSLRNARVKLHDDGRENCKVVRTTLLFLGHIRVEAHEPSEFGRPFYVPEPLLPEIETKVFLC